MNHLPKLLLASVFLLASSSATANGSQPSDPVGNGSVIGKTEPSFDWPHWRGPEYNGTSRETGLINSWNPAGGPQGNVLWKRDGLGGRSTPIVLNSRLYTMVGTEFGEKIICVDAVSGKTLWENSFNVWLSDVPKERVGWSSVVGDPQTGNVYALGVCGYFQCLDGSSGKTLWSVPMHEQFGLLSTYGGRTNFPFICEDLVIVSAIIIGWGEMAKPAHRFLAFDKETGEVVWFRGTRLLPYDTTYSSPTLTVLDHEKAMVFGSGDGALWAFQPRTGVPIWKFRFSRRGLNVAPLVVGDRVYSGHSEENIYGSTMGSVVALDASGRDDITDSHELWARPELMMGKASPCLIDDRLYCFDDGGKLHVLNADTGESIGRKYYLRGSMRASPLYADGKIYAFSSSGNWHILQPDKRRGVKVVKKGSLNPGEEVHASPICANGRIYLQTTTTLYCLEDPQQEHGFSPGPATAQERPVSEDLQLAHVQVVPEEVLMPTGGTKRFQARLYNARGQRLESAAASFSVDGPGQISSDGTYQAPDGTRHAAVTIRATVGDIQGESRVRIVPPLPWKFDFEDVVLNPRTGSGQPTITWVGARYRHVVRKIDGSNVLVKVTTIPKGKRSRCWFGHPELHDYTIQADVRAAIQDNKMPDIGLIAQGYALDLQGSHQKLQIRTWTTELRMAKTVNFDWQPDRWYTMKFRAANESGKAVLRGKAWPRGDPEPDQWHIKVEDDFPNRQGSPGLFGNAKDAELYLDNLLVFSNEDE